jgi:hypothetical protein
MDLMRAAIIAVPPSLTTRFACQRIVRLLNV